MDFSITTGRKYFSSHISLTIFFLLTLLFSNLSQAQATPPKDETIFKQNLAAAGLTYNLSGSNLEITIDQLKTIDALPKLQSLGYINSAIPKSAIEQKPTLITFTVGIIFTTAILHYSYDANKDIDKIHVTSYIVPKDAKAGKQECYSFDFTRALYTKTDWNKLSYNDFIKLIPNFNFSPWCRNLMTKEMEKKETEMEKKETPVKK